MYVPIEGTPNLDDASTMRLNVLPGICRGPSCSRHNLKGRTGEGTKQRCRRGEGFKATHVEMVQHSGTLHVVCASTYMSPMPTEKL